MFTKTLVAGLVSVIVPAALLVGAAPATAAAPVPDGRSEATAAASCWEIKQRDSSVQDGQYWLLTPTLRTPTRFYCDMTTDGGGWVLVGRGKNGWNWDGDATGTTAQVANAVTGTGAFAPRKLSGSTIDGLLDGGRVDALSDGIRLRRARTTDGTRWQEVRWNLKNRDRWSWAFGAGHPLNSTTFDGTSYNGGTTRDAGTTSTSSFYDRQYQRVWTFESSTNGWQRGFTYGQAVSGSTSSTSYLYASGNGNATPFTQVYIRPRLTSGSVSFATVPDTGTQQVKAVPVAENGAQPAPWGVTGTGAGGTAELATEAQAFAQIGSVVYVGGNFTTVRNADGSESVPQSYLAAFDASSGEWIRGFRPTFDNQVRSLTALPNGTLAVGGDFTTVNGVARRGLVALTTDGQTDPGFTTQVENRGTTGKTNVRALEVSNGQLYLGGQFTHVVKGTSAWYERNGARISLATGNGDSSWNPNLNGSVASMDIDDDGSRAYFAGYMTAAGSTAVGAGVAISTAPGAAVTTPAWSPTYSTTGKHYQQAVRQVGSKVWLGGSQHSMFSYDRSSFQLLDGNITKSGGDLQAIASNGTVVYGGCHCGDWNYSGTYNYDNFNPGDTNVSWRQGDKISLMGAWDSASGRYLTEFAPQWKSRGGMGVWGIFVANDGQVWAGGSLTSAVKAAGGNQWVGGFARFAQRPSLALPTPAESSASVQGSTATVRWSAVSGSGLTYQVLRNDRVVATTTGTSVQVPGASGDDRYFVRTTDGEGNFSASTSVILPTVSAAILDAGSQWAYRVDSNPVPDQWTAFGFDDSSWSRGQAPLGWGNAPVATNVDVATPADRPTTTYYRRSFTLDDPSRYSSYVLTSRADDGVVLYVNGQEVKRVNLPSGTIGASTAATAAPSTTTATGSPVVVEIPRSLLRSGTNTVTAEVHVNYKSSPSMSFDASIEGRS